MTLVRKMKYILLTFLLTVAVRCTANSLGRSSLYRHDYLHSRQDSTSSPLELSDYFVPVVAISFFTSLFTSIGKCWTFCHLYSVWFLLSARNLASEIVFLPMVPDKEEEEEEDDGCRWGCHYRHSSPSCWHLVTRCGVLGNVTRIVGGQEAGVGEYPWQAGLVYRGQYTWWW